MSQSFNPDAKPPTLRVESHVARKPHRCHQCGRRIPVGERYFCKTGGAEREHTNCLEFQSELMLHPMFNSRRSTGEITRVPADQIDSYGRLKEQSETPSGPD